MSSHRRLIPTLLSLISLLVVGSCTSVSSTNLSKPTPSATVKEVSLTPTRTLTFTPIPILSQVEAYTRFEELLLNNENCGLPCWWRLIPGESSFQEIQSVLIPLSKIATHNEMGVWDNRYSGYFDIAYISDANEIRMDIYFSTLPNQNDVAMFHIYSQVLHKNDSEPAYDDQKYLELMNAYTLSNILSTYGKPSRVVLAVDRFEAGENLMYIRLLYPEQGIFIQYVMKAVDNRNQVSGCPSKAFIELWLIPPSSDTNYQSILLSLSYDWGSIFPLMSGPYKSLENATNMDIDTFYQTFTESTNHCLETPSSLWPGM